MVINSKDKLCPMIAWGIRQHLQSGEWKRLRRPAQVHQIVCEEHQAKEMTAICGKHCHNLGQLEQSFYAGGKAATIYDHYESHQEWDTPNGACYCKECTTKVLKPTGQQVELTKKSDSKPKFLEEKETMMIHCASTDIAITDIRENTCTTNPSLRLIAIIYAYIDELTGNEGMDALQIGQVVKKWEGLWYS